jgi:hypothetical protein
MAVLLRKSLKTFQELPCGLRGRVLDFSSQLRGQCLKVELPDP